MKLCDYTVPEINVFRKNCNFVNDEIHVFEGRVSGKTIEQIAEELNLSVDNVYKISSKVNSKIARVKQKDFD